MTLGAGNDAPSLEEGDWQRRGPLPGGCAPPSSCVLQCSSLLIVGGALPRAPLPQDLASRDGHLCSCRVSPAGLLSPLCSPPLSLALSLSLSLALFSRGHSVSTRGTPLRAREWRLSRLARPFQRARAIPSFLPACLPVYSPFIPLSPSQSSVSHPLARPPQPALAPSSRRLPSSACARCHPDCLIVS